MKKRMLSMAVVAAAFLCFGSYASAQKTTKLVHGKRPFPAGTSLSIRTPSQPNRYIP